MNNFYETKLQDVVKISPSLLTFDYKKNILNILCHKYEGICSRFGYIKEKSIHIESVEEGIVEMSTFHGYVLFDVVFVASVCNPGVGSTVTATVKSINSFGLLCVAGYEDNGVYKNILNIVIPKQTNRFVNEASLVIFDNISVNDEVNVEILGKKYVLHNRTINIFGKLIDNVKTQNTKLEQSVNINYDSEGEENVESELPESDNELDEDESNEKDSISDTVEGPEETLDDMQSDAISENSEMSDLEEGFD